MVTEHTFLLDTNVFVAIENHPNNHEVWTALIDLILDGKIKTIEQVWVELKKWPSIGKLLKPYKHKLLLAEQYEDSVTRETGLVAIKFPNLYKQLDPIRNQADPWLVASAKILNFVLVTGESGTKGFGTKSLVNVCKQVDVLAMPAIQFINEIEISGGEDQLPLPELDLI